MSARAQPAPTASAAHGENGTALVGSTVGVIVFLAFLLLATQVLIGLYTTTVITSVTVDAATELSRAGDPTNGAQQQDATTRALRRMGSFAHDTGRVELDWSATTADEVVVTVHAHTMTLVPPLFGGPLGNRVDRTVHVRTEHLR